MNTSYSLSSIYSFHLIYILSYFTIQNEKLDIIEMEIKDRIGDGQFRKIAVISKSQSVRIYTLTIAFLEFMLVKNV